MPKKLNFSNNKLSNLPPSFGDLSLLEELNLDFNSFSEVPYVVSKLMQLRVFSAEDNKIRDISILLNCVSLQEIFVRNNRIKESRMDFPLMLPKLRTFKVEPGT